MEATAKKPSKDSLFITGIILIAFSALILGLTINNRSQDNFGLFFINYCISIAFLLAVSINNFSKYGWRLAKGKIAHTILLLILLLISAFSLNREMNVFEDSVIWLSIGLVLSSIALICASYINLIASKLVQYILCFCLGAAFVLFTYYAIYLLPLYIISIIGIVALGISIHTYIPLFLAIVTLIIIIRAVHLNKKLLYPVISGFLLPVFVCAVFLVGWYSTNKKIDSLINQNALNETKLSSWIAVSQQIEPSFITERILKAGLVYHEADLNDVMWNEMPNSSFDEKKKHDPLVVIASLFFKKPNLDEKEKINILKSIYKNRHQAQDRLWAGDHLQTASVISNIKLFPMHRMAYTEKTVTIRNDAKFNWSNQEAIYTFYLTEGSVVSSLSLWIDGKEEKSRLTTKAKADSAYQTIVGVENRDPSVIHWQEGNTITLRVFPCTPKENRKFKIGITSPLLKKGNQLTYQQIYFEGPSSANALESMQVTSSGAISGLQLPAQFIEVSAGIYRAEETNQPKWEISCTAPQLANGSFSFDNSNYQLANYEKKYQSFIPSQIYLDLNATWTQTEFDNIYEKLKGKPVYVYDGKLIKLNTQNKTNLFDRLNKQNFSLFPIYEISDPEHALLISKSSNGTPNLNDLDGTDFANELNTYLKTPKQIKLYHLGPLVSPYLKALKELRVFNYAEGEIADLGKLLVDHQFLQNQENEQTVVIEDAQLMIQKTDKKQAENTPDHLLRLFAYNDIMKKVGPNYFNKTYIDSSLIAEAQQAYIVSPISSMIVLETQKDYDRFDIEANKNSLKNASMKSSGAVPEPHEWVLFMLCIGIAAFMLFKKKKSPTLC